MTLDNLSNGDRTKWDFFLNMGAIEFLNHLSFVKDKQEDARIKMIHARHGAI